MAQSTARHAQWESRLRLPAGRSFPHEIWMRRHRGVLALLAAHAVGLAAFGIYMRAPLAHALFEGAAVGALALAAAYPRFPARVRSVLAAIGLMSSSAVLTHLSGGYIEAHFHFFVMLGVIFLYEDWLPYVIAVSYVAIHHGIAGTIDPLSVYNHPDAIVAPWKWASIHAAFIMGLSATLIVAWNVIERARISETRALTQAEELKRQLHTQEKMAALGSLVAGLAHEVRTPLTVVGASASVLELAAKRDPQNPLTPRVVAQAEEIRAGVDRINGLVLQLRRFHALSPDQMRVVSLDAVVRDAVRLFASANSSSRTIRTDLRPTPLARLDMLGVHQVVLNLLTNAVEATPAAEGVVTVRTWTEDGHAVLSVEDNGVGMSAQTRRNAFDPLFTTKKEGMGLGLHIVKRIIDAHDASITCESREGAGTRFEVRFPAHEDAAVTSVPVETRAAVAPAP